MYVYFIPDFGLPLRPVLSLFNFSYDLVPLLWYTTIMAHGRKNKGSGTRFLRWIHASGGVDTATSLETMRSNWLIELALWYVMG